MHHYCGIIFTTLPPHIKQYLIQHFPDITFTPYLIESDATELLTKMYDHHPWFNEKKCKKMIKKRVKKYPKEIEVLNFTTERDLRYVRDVKEYVRSIYGKRRIIHITDNNIESMILLSFFESNGIYINR